VLIYERIKEDLKTLFKDPMKRNFLRYIIGEFQRLQDKEVSDIKAVKLLRKLLNDSKEVIKLKKGDGSENELILLIESYLPSEASKEEIEIWIENNIDFSKFRNKMEAMKPIMEHFGSRSNGNIIRGILLTIDK
jgi:uncharacterized protein YqeY